MSFVRRNGRLLLCGAVVALFVASLSLLFARMAVPTGAWGLSFQQEGKPPVGNANAQALSQYDAVYLGDPEKPVIYLTFDAGYENGCTAQILDVLAAHHVKAAFFVVGNYLETAPELVRRMVKEGHIVGNHTYHHYDMSKICDAETFRRELDDTAALFREVTGQEMPKYYRPPQGIYSETNLRMAKELGYRTVFWSLAYVDWYRDKQPTREQAFSKLLPRIHNGAVVLLHATSRTNAEILDELLTRWENMGYTFGTIDQLFSKPDALSLAPLALPQPAALIIP